MGVIIKSCTVNMALSCGNECTELSAETGKKYRVVIKHGDKGFGCWCARHGKYLQMDND